MRSATIRLVCACIALFGWDGPVYAGGLVGSPFTPNSVDCGPVAGCDPALLNQYRFYHDVPFHLDQHVRQAKEADRDFVRKQSQKLIDELSVPCELVDAEQAGGGKITADGRMIDVEVYEAACRSGTGYFLVSQAPRKSLAISCFAAEGRRAADTAQGIKPGDFACMLPGNKDPKTMAAAVLKGAGTVCDVKDYRWVGVSYKNGTEYSEVACTDGQGYVIEIPPAGPATQISVERCCVSPTGRVENVKLAHSSAWPSHRRLRSVLHRLQGDLRPA